ncbi:MAG: class B sortase [Oscillospiraceae bacterium]
MNETKKHKVWMIFLAVLFLLAGSVCFLALGTALSFKLPSRAIPASISKVTPLLDRSAYVWVEPTEPPTEPPAEPKEEPLPTYHMTINMATVQANHNGNPDAIGWIRVPDTVVNYPIMQSADNDYYVNHSSSGAYSHAGAIFADYRCNLDKTDNALLYGHNMGNGSMFHAIKNYKSASWGFSHPYIEMASVDHRYLYRVISCNVIYGEAGASFEYWNYISMNRPTFRYYYDAIKSTSTVWYGDGVEIPKDNQDNLLVLQTCNSGASDGIRCVVFAVRIGDFTNESYYNPNVSKKQSVYPANYLQ